MRKLLLALSIAIASLALPTVPAQAHGVCSVTSITSLEFVVGGALVRVNASTFCSDVHVSTWIEYFTHKNGRNGPIVASGSTHCTDCRAVEIQAFLSSSTAPCSHGEKYVTQAFGWQRMDSHNIATKWSSRVTCPTSA